jgi:hypothetical protein
MSDDATTEEKQNFLRETILDKGYDVNKFVQFLIDKKGEGGADVAVWSMYDLQIVVKEFIKLNGGEVEGEAEEEQPQQENNNIDVNQQEQEIQKVEEKQEKKNVKKISMFDFMPSNKSKSEPINPKVQQTKPQPKPQPKLQKSVAIKEKDINPEVKKPTTTQNQTGNNNTSKVNKNLMPPSNAQKRSSSMSFVGSESEYGIITSDSKKCKSTDKTQLGKSGDLEITVSNPEKKETGFIKKTHVSYLITTLPLNFKVRRRYSDLSWFRQSLLNLFPANFIPAIPRKSKFGSDTLADPFIQKRLRAIERFLNYLVKDNNIKDSQILLDFLYIGSDNEFNNRKKVYENVKSFTEAQDFKCREEKANILITAQTENYLENIKDNVNININLLKKINNSFKQLFNEMKAVISRMEEISNYWTQIHKASLKYYDNNTTCETYKQLGKLFKTWSKILNEQNNIVNIDIREHFKFLRKNFVSIKDLGSATDKMKTNYQKSVKNLINKKEELYKKGEMSEELRTRSDFGMKDVSKAKALQLMLPKETNQTITAKEMYGLYLNRSTSEYERMRMLNGIWNKQIILENVTKLMNILTKFHVCVGEVNIGLETADLNNSNDNKCREKRIPFEEIYLK